MLWVRLMLGVRRLKGRITWALQGDEVWREQKEGSVYSGVSSPFLES